MTRVDGAASGCPNGAHGAKGWLCLSVSANKLGSSSPRNCLRLSQGAGQRLHGASHTHAGGGPRYDKQNFHSTQYTGTCTCLSILEQIPRERKREKSSPRHTTCAANMPIRFNSPQEFRARHSKTCPSSSLPSSRSNEHDGVAVFLRKYHISRHGTITDFLFVLGPIGVFSETVILFDQSPISHY